MRPEGWLTAEGAVKRMSELETAIETLGILIERENEKIEEAELEINGLTKEKNRLVDECRKALDAWKMANEYNWHDETPGGGSK